MPKLYRPSIPIEVKCRVAMRQLGEMWPQDVLDGWRYEGVRLSLLLEVQLSRLANLLGCARTELRLDHNPALGLRKKRRSGRMVRGKMIEVVTYTPPASHPEYLLYRSHAAHHIKTHVAGDGAQFSDTVLMKRERRRKKKPKGVRHIKRGAYSGSKSKASRPIPQRRNPWPTGRKLGRKR